MRIASAIAEWTTPTSTLSQNCYLAASGAIIGAAVGQSLGATLSGGIGGLLYGSEQSPRAKLISSTAFAAIKLIADHFLPGRDTLTCFISWVIVSRNEEIKKAISFTILFSMIGPYIPSFMTSLAASIYHVDHIDTNARKLAISAEIFGSAAAGYFIPHVILGASPECRNDSLKKMVFSALFTVGAAATSSILNDTQNPYSHARLLLDVTLMTAIARMRIYEWYERG